MRSSGLSLKLVLVLSLVCGLLSSAPAVNVSFASTNNARNKRFTENPYVPLLADIKTKQPDLICPKALILGFRGSGENPPEFINETGEQLTKGRIYTNWNWKKEKFSPVNYLKKQYLETADNQFYEYLFGKTVGKHVQILRSALAIKFDTKIKDIGIWSMGVDDLEFSLSSPPESFYNAPAVPSTLDILNPANENQTEFFRQIENSITQMWGGIVKDPKIDKLSTTNAIPFALSLLRKHCPNIEELTLIGYSQGAVMARFMAQEVASMKLPKFWEKTKLYLNLIADPLFDGTEGQMTITDLVSVTKKKITELNEAKGAMDKLNKLDCRPRFDKDKICTLKIGDYGPGGGKVFYVAPRDFIQTGATGSMCSTKCKYLEAAPANWQNNDTKDPIRTWAAVSNQSKVVVGASEVGIGSGFQNSLKIAAQSDNKASNSAAVLAREYRGDFENDWHLPSKNELYELMKTNSGVDLSVDRYWSSSQFLETTTAWTQTSKYQGVFGQLSNAKKSEFAVRPVRAFSQGGKTYETLSKDFVSIRSWCIWDDIVCNAKIKGSPESHSKYINFMPNEILKFYCKQLKKPCD